MENDKTPTPVLAATAETSQAAQSVPTAVSAALLPDKFDGKGFKTWQQKMLFYLTNIKLDKLLKEDKPVAAPEAGDVYTVSSIEAWTHSDFLCRGWILSRLVDSLYAVYNNEKQYPTAKHLWTALDKKYRSDDAGTQKFAVAKFLDFKMVDNKPIMAQVDQLQLLCNEIASEGMKICEPFTVNCFIEKLPPSWVEYKNYLKHKKKAMSLEDLVTRLQIEARNRCTTEMTNRHEQESYQAYLAQMAKAKGKAKVQPKNSQKNNLRPSGSTSFKKQGNVEKKFIGKCHNCGKAGHKSDVCRSKPKPKGRDQAFLADEDLCAVVTEDILEVNAVEENPREWWYDTGATTHICIDKDLFTTYQECQNERLKMANNGVSKILGRGKVVLKMTSGREHLNIAGHT